jgi:translocation and assembly module TamA
MEYEKRYSFPPFAATEADWAATSWVNRRKPTLDKHATKGEAATAGKLRKTAALAASAAAIAFCTVSDAHAFKLFGITLFGSEDEAVEVINPVEYEATIETGTADTDLAERLENAASLVNDDEDPVSGDLGLVVKAREDRDRLVAVLYEDARYGGIVRITIQGQDLDELPPNPTFDHSQPVPVTVAIDPGPAFTLGSVSFEGDAAGRDPEEYDLVRGEQVGSRTILRAGEQLLVDIKAEGRPLAQLTERQVTADHPTRTVHVVLGAIGGPVANLGAVTVKGSRTVEADFIQRYSRLDRGERYSPEQLQKASERLRELGVFSSVNIREQDSLTPEGTLPLLIEVSEGKHRYFGFGAEYASLDGAGVQAYWGHRNLFGEAESLRIEGKVSGIEATTDVETFNYSAGITFIKPGALIPEGTFEAKLQAFSETPDVYEAQSIVGSAAYSYELNETDVVKAGVEIAYIRADDAFGENEYLTFGTPISFERDARDNKLNPTEGYRATLEASPAYEAFNGTIFSSFEGSMSGYLGFGEEDRFVLAGRLAAGTLIGADELSDVPVTRRFFAGGGGSVRGYGYQEISPYNDADEALGGRSYTLASFEVRARVTQNIGIVPFIDVGTVSTELVPDFSDIRAGAGLGLRYATPFGPLRIDVAVPLQSYEGGSKYGIYAGIGQAF